MAFTTEELAILSQLSYVDIITTPESPKTLYDALHENFDWLKDELGDGYTAALEGLLEKVKGQDYTIVYSVNEKEGTGFSAFAVRDPSNEVTIACRGTEGFSLDEDSRRDVYADIQIGLQNETNQQQSMEAFMKYLERQGYDGYYFTGHSLGGNLAIHGALSVGDSDKVKGVTTFNAPGFNDYYWMTHSIKIKMMENRILNIENEYDYVSSVFTKPGKTYYVESNFSDLDPGFSHHGINGFKIDKKGFKRVAFKGARTVIPYWLTNYTIDRYWNLGILGKYIKAKITGGAKTSFRDFSQSAYDMMISAVKEVEDEDWWNVSRWDCWYRMDSLFGGFVMDYQLMSGDVDKYYRKIIDMNDASVKDISKIFDKAYEIDKKYATKINNYKNGIKNVRRRLAKIAESIVPSNRN